MCMCRVLGGGLVDRVLTLAPWRDGLDLGSATVSSPIGPGLAGVPREQTRVT